MYFSKSFLLAAVVGIAHAQTPAGFKPQVNSKLDVIFNTTTVSTAGQELSKAAVATQPQIALPDASVKSSDTYMFVMLDLDVPAANGSTTRQVLLHALITGFKATKQQINGSATLLASSDKGPAAYISPGPPATDTMAHRYVQLLYLQPASLKIQASEFSSTTSRLGFDITSFAAKNDIAAPIAGNYFRVDGRVNAAASGSATASGGKPTKTTVPFEGAAGKTDASLGLAGLLGGLALFAM